MKHTAKINYQSAKKNRDSICALGGEIYHLKLKVRKGEKISLSNLNKLKKYLRLIDLHDRKIWQQLINKPIQ